MRLWWDVSRFPKTALANWPWNRMTAGGEPVRGDVGQGGGAGVISGRPCSDKVLMAFRKLFCGFLLVAFAADWAILACLIVAGFEDR